MRSCEEVPLLWAVIGPEEVEMIAEDDNDDRKPAFAESHPVRGIFKRGLTK